MIEVRAVGFGHDVGAKLDQFAPQMQVVNQMAIVFGIDHGRSAGGELGEICCAADLLVGFIRIEKVLQGRWIGNLSAFDKRAAGFENTTMQRIGEVVRLQELRDPLICPVVDQDGAEKALLRLEVAGRSPVVDGFRRNRFRDGECFSQRHVPIRMCLRTLPESEVGSIAANATDV